MTLSQALSAEIARRGLSQKAAAEEIGVKQQALSRWLLGSARPSPQHLDQLATFLRVSKARVRELWAESTPKSAQALTQRVAALEGEVDELRRAITTVLSRLEARA